MKTPSLRCFVKAAEADSYRHICTYLQANQVLLSIDFLSGDLHRNSTDRNVPLLMNTSVAKPITPGLRHLDWPHDWLVLLGSRGFTRPSTGMVSLLCVCGLTPGQSLGIRGQARSPGKLAVWDSASLIDARPAPGSLLSTSVGPALCPGLDVFGQSPICPLSLLPAVCLALKKEALWSFLELRGERGGLLRPQDVRHPSQPLFP